LARDIRAGTTPTKPQKPKPQAIGGGAVGALAASVAPKPPVEKPQRPLQKIGFQGGILEFNNRLQQAHDAHVAAKGFEPTPGLALDVARSPLPTDQIPKLFEGATRLGALARQSLQGVDRSLGDPTDALLRKLKQASQNGNYQQVWSQHADEAVALFDQHPAFRDQVVKLNAKALTNAMGVGAPQAKGFGKILTYALTGVGQATEGLVFGPPTLAFQEGKGVAQSVGEKSLRPLAKTNVKLAKGVYHGYGRDIHHPGENPGNLFLDVFGAVSLGAGAATRAGLAGRALARGEAGAAARGLVERPRGGRIEMRKGQAVEQRLGSENMAVNAVQRLKQAGANKRMAARLETDEPAGAISIVRPLKARDWLENHFEPLRMRFGDEAKFRRERDARIRTQTNVAMSLKSDIEAVSGWSERTTMALGRLPDKMRRGLSPGEQKALQVLTLDDPHPLEAWRNFHARMIAQQYGDVKAHEAQLALLKLAGKALDKPSKRFKKAVALMYEAVAESERIKYEKAGLTPDIADKRVIAAGQVVRSGEKVGETPLPGERLSEHSLYVPFFSRAHTPRRGGDTGRAPTMRDSGYGIGPVQGLTEMKHEFTGEALRFGNFRWDTTNLVAESYARTVRFAAKMDQHRSIWDAASPTKRGPFDRPVRDVREIPDQLKELMSKADEGLLTERDAATLKPKELEKLNEFLYPEHPVPGVRWYDPALLEVDHAPIASVAKAVAQAANEVVRTPVLFLRPAYILNAVGNAGMAVLHQGHHYPPNMLRALMAKDLYGERVARKIDALAGSGKSKSYVNEKNLFGVNAIGRGLASAWSRVADDKFRASSMIHELRRLGYDLPLRKLTRAEQANLERILSAKATPKEAADVVEAARRANKAMVEFDNLSWVEREILKQVIFVYPWVSRSLVWSVRSVVEHPVKADVLAQIGADEQQEHPDLTKNVPDWFKKGGYIPVGMDKHGNPIVVNPTSVNSWSTMSQMLQTAQAGFVNGAPGTEFDSAFGMLGPVSKFLVRGFTGRDDYGNAYPGSDWLSAAKDTLNDLPQVAAYKRAHKDSKSLSPVDLAKRQSLLAHYKSALHRTVFSPGWADGYGMLVTAGLTPRVADKQALQARSWNELTLEKRHALEKMFLRDALHEQADFLLKRKVPDEVREAVDLASEMTWKAAQRSKELGRTVPVGTLERTLLDINTLAANHRIPVVEADELRKNARKAETPTDQRRFHSALMDKYAGGKQLQEWDDSVRFVASFTPQNLQAKLHALGPLSDIKHATTDQQALYEAGRQALAYRDKIKQLRKDAEALPKSERDIKLAELRAFIDASDKPIKVNGKVVAPSAARLDWAQMSQKAREDETRSLARRSWGSMSNFEKELAGKKVQPTVSEGWAELAKLKAEYKAQNFTTPSSDQIVAVAKALDRRFPGFYQDYLFSVKPKLMRFETLKPYRDMPPAAKAKFNELAGLAKQFVSAIKSGNYSSTEMRQSWTTYVNETIKPWLNEPDKVALRNWLEPYGPDFLSSLIGR
jgi:hypothetical protein